jgi:anti-anti-sigma factor
MKAKIRQDGDVTVVDLIGQIDFETVGPFRDTCAEMLQNSKVVFNLADLNFVGSSGIGAFVSTLRDFSNQNAVAPRFCHVKSEFQKIFKAEEFKSLQMFEDENMAMNSFISNIDTI